MTCCKFSTGCYLNCDLAACRQWFRKYFPKICGLCGTSRFTCKGKKSSSKLRNTKTPGASSKFGENLSEGGCKGSKGRVLGSATSANKIIDVENEDEEFCDCDLQEPASFVSCDPSNPIVAKMQGAIQSLSTILHQPSKSSQCSLTNRGSSVKVLLPPNTKSSNFCEPEHSCGRHISMAALVDKIRESVPCLSKVGDLCGEDSLCGKVISKAKSLDCAQSEKPRILLNKFNNLKNNVCEMHQKLQGIIPRVCMTFDKANRRVIVTPGKACDDIVAQCEARKRSENQKKENQCRIREVSGAENYSDTSDESRTEETKPINENNQSISPKPSGRVSKKASKISKKSSKQTKIEERCPDTPDQSSIEEKYSGIPSYFKSEEKSFASLCSNDSNQCHKKSKDEDSYANSPSRCKKEVLQ